METAETGEEALARCHGTSFDLVVTDLRLPGVTGLEILQALRNQGKQTPVIMMTAYGDVDTAVEAMRLGAYDFIPKPFKLSDIKKQVRAALRATGERSETPAAAAADERARAAPAKRGGDGRVHGHDPGLPRPGQGGRASWRRSAPAAAATTPRS